MRFTTRAALVSTLVGASSVAMAHGEAAFEVDARADLGPVNRYAMGGNFEFISAQTPEVAALATGIPIARFPGGDADSKFLWTDPPGDPELYRPYDWTAFAQLAAANRIDLFLEMNIVRGTPASAVAWIADARRRGLRVPYMGIGNEVWGDWDAGFRTPEMYAADVHAYATAIHARFPDTRVVLEIGTHNEDAWNRAAIRLAAADVDAIDYHFYPNHDDCSQRCPNVLEVVGGADSLGDNLARIRRMVREEAPAQAHRLQIVIGEWDGAADVPLPSPLVCGGRYMQWSMADALFYGAAIGEMLNGGVGAAMHYEVQGHRFGLIGGTFRRPADLTIHRPKEFALRFWREHFGDRRVRVKPVRVPSYWQAGPLDWDGTAGSRDCVKTYASLADGGQSLRLIVVNRSPDETMRVHFNLRDFDPDGTAHVWSVAGDSILAQNESLGGPHDAVRPYDTLARTTGATFTWTAAAHSVNAIEIPRARRGPVCL